MDTSNLAALITAIASAVVAVTGLVTAFKAHQKVNAITSQTPAGGNVSASVPPAGPQSLHNRYLDPWNRCPFPGMLAIGQQGRGRRGSRK